MTRSGLLFVRDNSVNHVFNREKSVITRSVYG